MGRSLIEIDNLSFRFSPNSPWLWKDLSFSQEEQQTVVVMGPSGCGKSSLLRLLLGSLLPENGSLWIRPETVVSMVFQDQRLLPWKTAEQNVAFGVFDFQSSRKEVQRQASEALDLVQAGHLSKRFPHELSGGEKQRVALARAIARRGDLILMDEPLSAIDEISQRQLLDCLLMLKQELKTSILYVTHSSEEALVLGDKILQYRNGSLSELSPAVKLPAQRGAR